MLLILIGISFQCIGQETISKNHTIKIESNNDYLTMEESISLDLTETNYSELSFWIMDDASSVKISVNDNKIDKIITNENIYTCNISNLSIDTTDPLSVNINYRLESSIEDSGFEKILQRDTNKVSVTYDSENIYSATNLKENSKFTVQLIKYEEETFSILTIVAVFLIVILLIVFTAYFLKKQKIIKKKHALSDSEEYLFTKKTLLMQLLKDIEKRHRAKKISDDTYNKLKDHYKNEAVETMKKMEDMKSEIK